MTALRTFASAAAEAVYTAINAADCPETLHDCGRNLWRAYGEGEITEDDATFLGSCIDRRRPPGPCSPQGHLKAAAKPVAALAARLGGRLKSRQRLRCPNRKASRDRRRKLGGSSALPADLRCAYTEGQRAVLCIIAGEVKHHGICDLPIDKIGALAGVCRTTVQTTLHLAKNNRHITIEERPRPGRKHLTNVVSITSPEWLTWIKRGPSAHRPIGSNSLKMVSTTKNIFDDVVVGGERKIERGLPSKEEIEFAEELATIAGHKTAQLPDLWTKANAVRAVQSMLSDAGPFARTGEALAMVRIFANHIATARAKVGDPPSSPRYFAVSVRRMREEWERSLQRPLPTWSDSNRFLTVRSLRGVAHWGWSAA